MGASEPDAGSARSGVRGRHVLESAWPEPGSSHGVVLLYRQLWRLSRGCRGRLLTALGTLALSRLVKLSPPLLFAVGVNALQRSQGEAIGTAALCVLGAAGANALYLALYVPARTLERDLALDMRSRLTDDLYVHLVGLPLGWHEHHHSGEVAHRFRTSTEALFEFAQSQAFYIQSVMTLLGSVGALLFFDLPTAAVAVAGYGLLVVLLVTVDRPLVTAMNDENEAEARLSAEITDHTGNAVTVLTLGLAARTRVLLKERLAVVVGARRRVIRLQQRKWAVVDGLNDLMWCLLVATAGWSTWSRSGVVEVGTVVLVGQYASAMAAAVPAGVLRWQQLQGYAANHLAMEPIRAARPDQPSAHQVTAHWQRIEVRGAGLQFRARHGGEPAGLHEITLDLHRGERIALVGPSGAGKSTLLRLLAGVLRTDTGSLVVDGRPLGDLRALRDQTTLAPQESEIFTTTLRHNLTLGLEPDPDLLLQVCRIAQLDDLLAELPDGLDTHLAERGLNLSGGQRQRMALARGLLAAHGRSLLLLDEPTSNLDPATEQRVYGGVLAAFPDICVVSSVHRLNLLPWFDRVVLMDAGRVLDTGTPEELLRRQPLFRRLCASAPADDPGAGLTVVA